MFIVILFCRQKSRASQAGIPTPPVTVQAKGPDEDKIKAILERTGYTLDVTTGFYSKSIKTNSSYSNNLYLIFKIFLLFL